MFNLTRLKAIRIEKGLTQKQLSEISGVKLSSIKSQEQGVQKDAFLSLAAPLAQALGVRIEDLFFANITIKNVIQNQKGDQ